MEYGHGFGHLAHLDKYREATLRQASLPGVTRLSFICRKCGLSRGISGRKRVVQGTTRFGFYCAHCVAGAAH